MNIETSRRQGGFTLIELVVVIVVLGILAAFAIPRFVDVNTDARVASMRGIAGSISSSMALSHGLALARGRENSTITMEGETITMVHGYPQFEDIDLTVSNVDGYTFDETTDAALNRVRITPANGPSTCVVLYIEAANASTPARVDSTAIDIANCE